MTVNLRVVPISEPSNELPRAEIPGDLPSDVLGERFLAGTNAIPCAPCFARLHRFGTGKPVEVIRQELGQPGADLAQRFVTTGGAEW